MTFEALSAGVDRVLVVSILNLEAFDKKARKLYDEWERGGMVELDG